MKHLPRIIVQSITEPRRRTILLVYVGSAITGFIVGGAILLLDGHNPIEVYKKMLDAAFGSSRAMSDTLAQATPLIFTGLAFAIAQKMQLYNIGGEGQLLIGATTASGIAIVLGGGGPWVMIPLVFLAGALGGAALAGIAGLVKAKFGASEIVTTLMLNFVSLKFVNYLIFPSNSMWKEKQLTNFPTGKQIPDGAQLPKISGQLTLGFFIAVSLAILLALVVRHTNWGFRLRILGDSLSAAHYAGIGVFGMTISVLSLSGALAGLAGAALVVGPIGALEPRSLSIGLGFVGILVAALARSNLVLVVPVAIAIAAIQASRYTLQALEVPSSMIAMLQGMILISIGMAQFFLMKRISLKRKHDEKVIGETSDQVVSGGVLMPNKTPT